MYKTIILISILLIIGLSCNKNYQQSKKNDMNYNDIKSNEGKEIEIIGKFKHQESGVPFSTHKLILSDNTELIISLDGFENKEKVVKTKNNGKTFKIIGKVYIDEIPDEYQIIGRTDNPYIVAIQSIELL